MFFKMREVAVFNNWRNRGFNLEDSTDGIPEVDILEKIDIDDDQDDIEELIDLVCDWCEEIVLPNYLTCKHCHVKRSCKNPDCKKKIMCTNVVLVRFSFLMNHE